MKLSNHNVRSPVENIKNACQNCHNVPGKDLLERVTTIQHRTKKLIERAEVAMNEMLDAIVVCWDAGAMEDQLQDIRLLQRKSMWRLDYISSENSKRFHAPQESARVFAESINYSRQATIEVLKLLLDLRGSSTSSNSAD